MAFWPSPLLRTLALTTVTVRVIVAAVVSRSFLRSPSALRTLWLVPFTDVLSFVIWCVSLRGDTVRWSENTFRVHSDGKMVRVG